MLPYMAAPWILWEIIFEGNMDYSNPEKKIEM
jgi:hypothetical protein